MHAKFEKDEDAIYYYFAKCKFRVTNHVIF